MELGSSSTAVDANTQSGLPDHAPSHPDHAPKEGGCSNQSEGPRVHVHPKVSYGERENEREKDVTISLDRS